MTSRPGASVRLTTQTSVEITVVIGYGDRNNDREHGQRYLGAMTLRGIGGNHAENVWGSFEEFLNHVEELTGLVRWHDPGGRSSVSLSS